MKKQLFTATPPLLFLIVLFAIPPLALGQEGDQQARQGVRTFDDVRVERVRPSEIPDFRPGLPRGATQRSIQDLPRNLTAEELDELARHASARTVVLLASQTPPRPYRQTPMLYEGHGIFVSPHRDGSAPVLITTADWIEDAEQIFIYEGRTPRQHRRDNLPRARQDGERPNETISDGQRFLRQNMDKLVEVQVTRKDRQVNLAALSISDSASVQIPETGFVLHDMDEAMTASLFGFSPLIGTQPVPTRHVSEFQNQEEFSFYFLTNFQAILGAPILDRRGKLLGITALRHPSEQAFTLTIPPGAIHYFMGTDQGRSESSDVSR